ncbi:MAG: DUF1801 domain-containing protein [Saprospiraceae bacterium]|nr:DUF1801 domain-containing protein [Saprospiraceae bacterium]
MSRSNKTRPTDADVRQFLGEVDNENRRKDAETVMAIMERITGHKPTMWGPGIIGFDTYHYKYESGREGDFFKVGLSPRKQNLSVYILPGFDRYENLLSQLGKYKTGKSCLYINRLSDVDMDVLEELISESYRFMNEKYG